MKETDSRHDEAEEFVVTSIRLKKSTRQAAKVYAAEHDTTLQCVVDEALKKFLDIK